MNGFEEQITFESLNTEQEKGAIDVFSVLNIFTPPKPKEDYMKLFLRFCDNTQNARTIVTAEFSKQKDADSKIEFLKKIYHGGCGYEINGKKQCCFFDESGMHLNSGAKAFGLGSKTIEWREVSDKITEMLENGEYATSEEVSEAPFLERQMLAESLWYLERDLTEEGQKYFTCFDILEDFSGFPDDIVKLKEELQSRRYVEKLKNEFDRFADDYAKGYELLRFRFHKVEEIRTRISDMFLPRKQLDSTTYEDDSAYTRFITDDEIQKSLSFGSGVSGGKDRIREFFEENKDSKNRADFLKNEYGTGGHSHAVSGANHSGESHDSNGVVLNKQGCSPVKLTWTEVANIIAKLISERRYVA